MPVFRIYFNLPCGSFTPQFPIFLLHGFVLSNIMYFLSTLLHSCLRFHAILDYRYFFSRQLSPFARAARFNRPHLSHHPPHIFLLLHSHTPSLLFPSTITSSPHSHRTGIPIPVINNASEIARLKARCVFLLLHFLDFVP